MARARASCRIEIASTKVPTSAIFTAGEALNRDRARGGDRTIIHKNHAILRAWLQRAAVASAVRIERELPNILAEGDRHERVGTFVI